MHVKFVPFYYERSEFHGEMALIDVEAFGEENAWGVSNFQSKQTYKEELSFIALQEQKVIGYIIASVYTRQKENIAHVNRIAVHKDFSNLKIGKQLLSLFEEKAKSLGASKITLEADSKGGVSGFYLKNEYFQITHPDLILEYLKIKNKTEKLNKYLIFEQLIFCKSI